MSETPQGNNLPAGLYEEVITAHLAEILANVDTNRLRVAKDHLDPGESHSVLAKHMGKLLASVLARVTGAKRIQEQTEICNRLIDLLASLGLDFAPDEVAAEAMRLLAIIPTAWPKELPRPDTPLARGCLLTGTRLDPSLLSQLRKEIASSDRLDILCSFIKWSGIRILEDELRAFTARPGARLRVITTSYMGATDLKAVEFVQSLANVELKLSYDTHRTRLHAKAYMFRRESGFGTAYIGSANLTHAALTEGLEWNVKVSQYESPHLWDKVTATFETYWNDAEFVSYSAEDRQRLRAALEAEREGAESAEPAFFFDLRPYAFQAEILDRLEAERELQGRTKHLVVAATGTGKTMIAAFDYRSVCRQAQQAGNYERPRLLFVAHREEILKQSLNAFRAVLRDQNFGDLLVGGHVPESHGHLFVSIQSYNSRELQQAFPPDFFEYVVVDEFHHAAAPSYASLLDHVRPNVLLGLTATPERTDGLDVLLRFDGHISAELRLPDAIGRKLLCPFQYFGVSDSVDFSGLRWQRGGYQIDDLDRILTGNDARAGLVIDKVREKLLDPRKACGLGFCVSIAHAHYMADRFCQAGIPSAALTADSSAECRRTIQERLVNRDINFIFTVDLYNEGVDIPEIDTVLFLRPTESLTVFLQQLGRGLRLSDGKDCLTVLDLVGQSHRNYRFEPRYRALLDDPTRSVLHELQADFPHLPAGCSIHLERVAAQRIVENIRQNLAQARSGLVRQIAEFASEHGKPPPQATFLEHYGLEVYDIYRRDSWSRLCVEAGVRAAFDDPDEPRLAKGLRRLAHWNDPETIRAVCRLLRHEDPESALNDGIMAQRFLMLQFSLWGRSELGATLRECLHRLRSNPTMCDELIDLLELRLTEVSSVSPRLQLPFEVPLSLHAEYTRDEILAALGHWTLTSQPELREGVLYLPRLKTDIFLVTLDKTEKHYSPTTMYEDYAISEELFHWQSQSTTSVDSPTGHRYLRRQEDGQTVLLFVRETKNRHGLSSPYSFLGPVDYVRHAGSRPISIVWKLKYPMPARLLRRTARLATG